MVYVGLVLAGLEGLGVVALCKGILAGGRIVGGTLSIAEEIIGKLLDEIAQIGEIGEGVLGILGEQVEVAGGLLALGGQLLGDIDGLQRGVGSRHGANLEGLGELDADDEGFVSLLVGAALDDAYHLAALVEKRASD